MTHPARPCASGVAGGGLLGPKGRRCVQGEAAAHVGSAALVTGYQRMCLHFQNSGVCISMWQTLGYLTQLLKHWIEGLRSQRQLKSMDL